VRPSADRRANSSAGAGRTAAAPPSLGAGMDIAQFADHVVTAGMRPPQLTADSTVTAEIGWQTAHQLAHPNAPVLGDEHGALGAALAGLDPAHAAPCPELVTAAVAYARCGNADPGRQQAWLRYAYRSARHLWTDTSPATDRISHRYQQLLTKHRRLWPAVLLGRHRIELYRQAGEREQALTAGVDVANLLHDGGACAHAEQQILDCWHTWLAHPHPTATGRTILLTRAAMLAACGRPQTAIAALRRNATLLNEASSVFLRTAARWLTTAETAHADVCGRPGRPRLAADRERRQRMWTAVLRQVTANRQSRGSAEADGPAEGGAR